MQTFMPIPDYDASAAALDDLRLGNQCYREAKTLWTGGWINHPASKMWRSCDRELARYGLALAREMARRDRWRDEVVDRWLRYWRNAVDCSPLCDQPWWLGWDDLHASHRSNLLRKDPAWYGRFRWAEPDDLPYVWPSEHEVCERHAIAS